MQFRRTVKVIVTAILTVCEEPLYIASKVKAKKKAENLSHILPGMSDGPVTGVILKAQGISCRISTAKFYLSDCFIPRMGIESPGGAMGSFLDFILNHAQLCSNP